MMPRQWIQARILVNAHVTGRPPQVNLAPTLPFFRAAIGRILLLALTLSLTACASLSPGDSPRVDVVGIEPLSGQGMEMRMVVRLRVINPSETALDFDGVFVEMDVRGKSFAAGVSDARGSVPRFGEVVLAVPVTVSAFAAVRQMLGIVGDNRAPLDYQLRGKLAGPLFGGHRFQSEGEFKLPGGLMNDGATTVK